MFEISTPEFVKNEFLAKTGNFSIGFAFSKSPGSTFSEHLDPDPGPLYKVWNYSQYFPSHFT